MKEDETPKFVTCVDGRGIVNISEIQCLCITPMVHLQPHAWHIDVYYIKGGSFTMAVFYDREQAWQELDKIKARMGLME